MRPKTMTIVLVGSAVAAWATWSEVHSRPGPRASDTASTESVRQDSSLVLAGVLGPVVTIPIEAPIRELTVPLDSWVLKGQVIGATESEITPAQFNQARFWLDELTAAAGEAQERIGEIEADLDNAYAAASDCESQLISSENAELQAEHELEHHDLLFREGVRSEIDHEQAVWGRDSAVSVVAEEQSRLRSATSTISELEQRSRGARARLAELKRHKQAAEAVALQMEQSAGWVQVVSPADGLIVERDPVAGTFGIASDATRLRVVTQVPEADIGSVRVGQQASVSIDGEPAVTLNAAVSEIAVTPISSPDGSAYQVALAIENPEGMRFTGVPVRIRFQASPQ